MKEVEKKDVPGIAGGQSTIVEPMPTCPPFPGYPQHPIGPIGPIDPIDPIGPIDPLGDAIRKNTVQS